MPGYRLDQSSPSPTEGDLSSPVRLLKFAFKAQPNVSTLLFSLPFPAPGPLLCLPGGCARTDTLKRHRVLTAPALVESPLAAYAPQAAPL